MGHTILRFLLFVSLCTGAMLAGTEQWKSLGPEGGSFRFLVIDPEQSSVIYVVSDSGRLFKSADGGTSWKSLPFPEFAVGALAINPLSTSTLYVGTLGGGIYRSS